MASLIRPMLKSWPPPPGTVVAGAPYALLVISVPIAVLAMSTMSETLSEEELEEERRRTAKRKEQVDELVCSLDENEDIDSNELGQVELGELLGRVGELVSAEPKSKILERAIEWCGKLVAKTLRIGTARTIEQEDEEWRDGSKLERELHHANWLEGLISATGFKPSAAVAADVKATTAAAKAARESMKGMAKYKAMQTVLLGRSAFPWVASQGLVGALATACGACTTYYRAVALEAFKDSASGASGWRTFGVSAAAILSTELVATGLRMLEDALRTRGINAVTAKVQVEHFRCLSKKELKWWASKKGHEGRMVMHSIWDTRRSVEQWLDIPHNLLTTLVDVGAHAALILRTSSKALYIMMGINLSKHLLDRGLHRVRRLVEKRITKGLVQPSRDDFTWFYALNPDYIQMMHSFNRTAVEATNYRRYIESEARFDRRHTLVDTLTSPVFNVSTQGTEIAQIAVSGSLVQSGMVGIAEAVSCACDPAARTHARPVHSPHLLHCPARVPSATRARWRTLRARSPTRCSTPHTLTSNSSTRRRNSPRCTISCRPSRRSIPTSASCRRAAHGGTSCSRTSSLNIRGVGAPKCSKAPRSRFSLAKFSA